MKNLTGDLRHAVRRLRRAPLFTLFAVVTLSLGIGSVVAVYSVVYATLLRAPSYAQGDRVVNLYDWPPATLPSLANSRVAFSWPDFRDLEASQSMFSKVAAWTRFNHAVITEAGGRPFQGELVDGDYFDVVGIQPALGRLIQPADDDPAAPPVLVLGHEFWISAFNADPTIVGRTVMLDRHPFTVIGVAGPDFRGVHAPNLISAAVWMPIRQRFLIRREGYLYFRDPNNRETRWVRGIGRLRDGVSLDEARAELLRIGHALDATAPVPGPRNRPRVRDWSAHPASTFPIGESERRIIGPLMTSVATAVALVMLVVCANIATLVLAQGANRSREIAVRLAIGASRWRVVREQVIDSALIAGVGAANGLLLARLLVSRVIDIPISGLAVGLRARVDQSAVIVAAYAALVAVVLVGIVPAWRATRLSASRVLTDGVGGAVRRWRGRRVLIAVQVAVSAILLVAATASVGELYRQATRATGLDLDQLAIVGVDTSMTAMPETDARASLRDAAMHSRSIPGVSDVSIASGVPTNGRTGGAIVYVGNRGEAPDLDNDREGYQGMAAYIADQRYFATVGLPLNAGRGFDATDTASSAPVVVVNANAARQLFSTVNVIGRTIEFVRQTTGPRAPNVRATIVGVAADTDLTSFDKPEGVVYLPWAQHHADTMLVIARTASAPGGVIAALSAAVVRADTRFTTTAQATGVAFGDTTGGLLRFMASAGGILGSFALVLALAGIYGVLSFVVTCRRQEFGVRMALGATPGQVRRSVTIEGVRTALWGLGIAAVVTVPLVLSPMGANLMPDVPMALATTGLTLVTLLLASALAAYFPARRVSHLDPTAALRND